MAVPASAFALPAKGHAALNVTRKDASDAWLYFKDSIGLFNTD
jgi:hypothetical protein